MVAGIDFIGPNPLWAERKYAALRKFAFVDYVKRSVWWQIVHRLGCEGFAELYQGKGNSSVVWPSGSEMMTMCVAFEAAFREDRAKFEAEQKEHTLGFYFAKYRNSVPREELQTFAFALFSTISMAHHVRRTATEFRPKDDGFCLSNEPAECLRKYERMCKPRRRRRVDRSRLLERRRRTGRARRQRTETLDKRKSMKL